jgi:hypothetical protein
MIERFAQTISPVLEFPLVRKTRRNHALEHATIHVLARKVPNLRMAGRSTDGGFLLFGEVETEAVEQAVEEALRRMRNGEHGLAIHPNCGTNLVTAGALTTFTGMVGLRGSSKPLTVDRISWTMVLMMFAVLFSQPLGRRLQKHITTKGEPGDLEVVSVTRGEAGWALSPGQMVIHRVVTRGG